MPILERSIEDLEIGQEGMWGKSKGHSGKEDGSRMESEGGKPRLVIVGGGWGVSFCSSFLAFGGVGEERRRGEGERREEEGGRTRVRERERETKLTFRCFLFPSVSSRLDS